MMFYALTGVWTLAVITAAYLNFNTKAGAKVYVTVKTKVDSIYERVWNNGA